MLTIKSRDKLRAKLRTARAVHGILIEAAQAYREGKLDYTIALYRRAISMAPKHADSHNNLGVALMDKSLVRDAEVQYRRAIEINPDHADAHNNLGIVLRTQGRIEDAVKEYDKAIAIKPDYAEARFNRADCVTMNRSDIGPVESVLPFLPLARQPYACFSLAKTYEDLEEYDLAWEYYEKGNTLKRKQVEYDEGEIAKFFSRIKETFTPRLMRDLVGMRVGVADQSPIFILGMPRSGSTLIEQILASHPDVYGGGELEALERAGMSLKGEYEFPECVGRFEMETFEELGKAYLGFGPGASRFTDKLPGNFLMVGLIRLILPHAKIIHTTRDPLDTCLSCYSKLFKSGFLNFSYDLGELGRFYRRYHDLMSHWRTVIPSSVMLDVKYEDVVNNLQWETRKILEHCGLHWDPACLDFHKTQRLVHTASAVQVRQPLFKSSVGKWQRYEKWLGPLTKELEGIT